VRFRDVNGVGVRLAVDRVAVHIPGAFVTSRQKPDPTHGYFEEFSDRAWKDEI